MADVDDGELLARTCQGEADAFGVLYERRRAVVLAFLIKRVGAVDVAMDLMAETFASALLALQRRAPVVSGSATPWLLAIARNLLIDSYRRGQVEDAARRRLGFEPVTITGRDADLVLEAIAETDLIASLQQQLSREQFAALQARVLEDRSYDEIARDLSCSPAVIRKRVSRAVAILKANRGAQP